MFDPYKLENVLSKATNNLCLSESANHNNGPYVGIF